MYTDCRIPIAHSTKCFQYYDLYLQITSSQSSCVRLRGFTNCCSDQGKQVDGILLETLYPGGFDHLVVPFVGNIRFVIPEEARIADNVGLCIRIESDHEVCCKLYDVLLNNQFGKPHLLNLDHHEATYQPFHVDRVSYIEPKISKEQHLASFEVPCTGENDYILLYQSPDQTDNYDDNECSLFIPKTNFCLDEPITFTYHNLYLKYDINLYMVDLLLYLEGDKPGIDRSRDYLTVIYQEHSRGLNGSYSFPTDGARSYFERFLGKYTLCLMQKYDNLCAPQQFSISTQHRKDELKAPPPGSLFYIKARYLPEYLEISMKHPEKLFVLHFTSSSPMVELLEQSLYRMQDIEYSAHLLRKAGEKPQRLLQSVACQMLQTAYTLRIQALEEAASIRVAHSLADRVAAFINHNLGNNITMQTLVDVFHMSESHLSHSFKRSKNLSISKFIYNAKITRAKQWLSENEMTVTEIARLLNYSDIHAFSHSFKILVGVSPLEYRKMNQKQI